MTLIGPEQTTSSLVVMIPYYFSFVSRWFSGGSLHLQPAPLQILRDFDVDPANVRNALALFTGEGSAPQVNGIQVGDPAKAIGPQHAAIRAPGGGFHRHQTVVGTLQAIHHEICRGELEIGEGMPHHAGIALVKDSRYVRVFPVETFRRLGGEALADRQEVRLFVPHHPDPVVHGEGGQVEQATGHFEQQIHRFGAPVGRGDGGDAGDSVPCAQGGGSHPGFQPALGMGDEIHLLRPGLRQDLVDPPHDLGGVGLCAGPAVLQAVADHRASSLQRRRDPSPVDRPLQIPEPRPVDQHQGVSGMAGGVSHLLSLLLNPIHHVR